MVTWSNKAMLLEALYWRVGRDHMGRVWDHMGCVWDHMGRVWDHMGHV